MNLNTLKIRIRGGAKKHDLRASGFYLITVDQDGNIQRARQNALDQPPARDYANDTYLAGAMIWAAEQLIRRIEKTFPGMDVRAKAQEVYEDLKRQDEESGALKE